MDRIDCLKENGNLKNVIEQAVEDLQEVIDMGNATIIDPMVSVNGILTKIEIIQDKLQGVIDDE